jgi:hypothetical protein
MVGGRACFGNPDELLSWLQGAGRRAARVMAPDAGLAAGRASVVAVAPTVDTLEEVRQSHWGALTTLRVAESTVGPGHVTRWNDLDVLHLLAAPADEDLGRAVFSGPLRASVSDPRRHQLHQTARTYLGNAGSVARTATELSLHRQTQYHSLAQVERATGLDLKDGHPHSGRTSHHDRATIPGNCRPRPRPPPNGTSTQATGNVGLARIDCRRLECSGLLSVSRRHPQPSSPPPEPGSSHARPPPMRSG